MMGTFGCFVWSATEHFYDTHKVTYFYVFIYCKLSCLHPTYILYILKKHCRFSNLHLYIFLKRSFSTSLACNGEKGPTGCQPNSASIIQAWAIIKVLQANRLTLNKHKGDNIANESVESRDDCVTWHILTQISSPAPSSHIPGRKYLLNVQVIHPAAGNFSLHFSFRASDKQEIFPQAAKEAKPVFFWGKVGGFKQRANYASFLILTVLDKYHTKNDRLCICECD